MAEPQSLGLFCSSHCRITARKPSNLVKLMHRLPESHPKKDEWESKAAGISSAFIEHWLQGIKVDEGTRTWLDSSSPDLVNLIRGDRHGEIRRNLRMELVGEIQKYGALVGEGHQKVEDKVKELSGEYFLYIKAQAANKGQEVARSAEMPVKMWAVERQESPKTADDKEPVLWPTVPRWYNNQKAKTKRDAEALGIDPSKIISPCHEECQQICQAYNDDEAEAIALPDSHARKKECLTWCENFEKTLYEHAAGKSALLDRQVALITKVDTIFVDVMSKVASEKTTSDDLKRYKLEMGNLRKDFDDLAESMAEVPDLKDGHEAFRELFDVRPAVESVAEDNEV